MKIRNFQWDKSDYIRFPLVAVALITLLFLIPGCGKRGLKGLVSCSGVVTLDGAPVEGANILFATKGSGAKSASASAITDAEGKFQLMTVESGDGAFPGEYRVSVMKTNSTYQGIPLREWQEKNKDPKTGQPSKEYNKDKVKIEYIVPEKYSDVMKSGLEYTIPTSGAPEIKLELTSK